MIIPKNTKLTLKRIVERIDELPSNPARFDEKQEKLSTEKKQRLLQLTAMFEKFGECLKDEACIVESANNLSELCELATTYAVNECGDWFQADIVKKDMQQLEKKIAEFQKIAKETFARMQQLGVAYQDIGHVLGRYYDINPSKSTGTPNMLGKDTDTDIDVEAPDADDLGNDANSELGTDNTDPMTPFRTGDTDDTDDQDSPEMDMDDDKKIGESNFRRF